MGRAAWGPAPLPQTRAVCACLGSSSQVQERAPLSSVMPGGALRTPREEHVPHGVLTPS